MIIEEEEKEEREQEGFIVPDDYLSASEMNFSQSDIGESQIEAELEERRKNLQNRNLGKVGTGNL